MRFLLVLVTLLSSGSTLLAQYQTRYPHQYYQPYYYLRPAQPAQPVVPPPPKVVFETWMNAQGNWIWALKINDDVIANSAKAYTTKEEVVQFGQELIRGLAKAVIVLDTTQRLDQPKTVVPGGPGTK